MKILVITPVYYPENFCVTPICEDLVKRGNIVHVVTGLPNYGLGKIYPGYEKPGFEKRNGVLIHRAKIYPRKKSAISIGFFYFSLGYSLLRNCQKTKEEYDLVFSFCLSPLTIAIAANNYSKKHKIPHVHFCLDVWPESIVEVGYIKKKTLIYRALFHWCKNLYSKMDRILISSPSFSSFFTQEMSIPKSRIFYLPQPVEIPPHNETSKFYSEKYSFVYAGNIGKLQQIDKIVEACVPFANDRSFSFHILGKGSEVSRVKFLIKKLGLEHSVFYDGYISSNQIGSYLSSATVLVVSLKNGHTVVSQTIPNKLSSYLAYKKPILGVIEGDGKALIDQIGAGITCGDQVGAISNAISSFMKTSEEEMKCIGLRNYEYFCKHFAFETLMNELSEHLKAMVEKNDAKKGAKDQKL